MLNSRLSLNMIYRCTKSLLPIPKPIQRGLLIKLSFYKAQHNLLSLTSIPWNASSSHLENLLRTRFPSATAIQVEDISGGCGAMFEVWVESEEFKKLSRVKQHKLITEALKKEIKDMHGLRINTTVPKDS